MQNPMSLPDTKITSPTAAISDRFKKAEDEYFGLKGRFRRDASRKNNSKPH